MSSNAGLASTVPDFDSFVSGAGSKLRTVSVEGDLVNGALVQISAFEFALQFALENKKEKIAKKE
jgi:hypothetical protein